MAGPGTFPNLCSVSDLPQTQSSIVAISGVWTFESVDMVSYPPGTYTIRITGTSGNEVQFFETDVVLVDPCPTVDLGLKANPFTDQTYNLFDPALS